MELYQHTEYRQRTYTWQIDVQVAQRLLPWAARRPDVLVRDLEGMRAYFPHWLLLGARNQQPLRCDACAAPGVPTAGALRCVCCRKELAADSLIWRGDIPALARVEPRFQQCRRALREAGFADIQIADQTYLLVPLMLTYPAEWPNEAPLVRYATRWLAALGLPASSAAHHIVGNGHACIYAWGQWQAEPVHAVLQQRMVNHVASLLKIAAGQSPQQAFIGRIHNDAWQPHE